MPDKKRHDRQIEELILAGLIALRRAIQAAFILRLLQLTTQQIITEADRRRVLTVLQAELSLRTHFGGPIYESIVGSVRKAGPDIQDYETSVIDDHGLILPTRLERAKLQLVSRVNDALLTGISHESARADVSTEVFQILAMHSGFKRVMAYDTARAYNLQSLSTLLSSNADSVRIQLSEEHIVNDICDRLVGVFPISEITGSPYRRLPPFHPFCKCYVVPFKE
jgi:hypothetical protein